MVKSKLFCFSAAAAQLRIMQQRIGAISDFHCRDRIAIADLSSFINLLFTIQNSTAEHRISLSRLLVKV